MVQYRAGNIEDAFAILLEEIETEVERITQEGQLAFAQRDFARAASLVKEAEAVEVYVARVKALQQDWSSIVRIPAPLAPTPILENHAADSLAGESRKSSPRRQRSKRTPSVSVTPRREYRRPILEALVELGGRGQRQEVLEKVFLSMRVRLLSSDFARMPSSPDTIRWMNTASFERAAMVEEGLLLANSPYGYWEISAAGRDWLSILPPESEQVVDVRRASGELTPIPRPAESTAPVSHVQPSSIRSIAPGTSSTRSGAPRSFRARTGGPRAPSEEITPQQAFRLPILEILVELGGSARKVVVEERLYARMRDVLKPADFKGHQSRTNQIRWKNSAQWSRAGLVEEGLMISTSPRGVWEISDSGRTWLAKQGHSEQPLVLGEPLTDDGRARLAKQRPGQPPLSDTQQYDRDETEYGTPAAQGGGPYDEETRTRRPHKNLDQGKRTHEHEFRVPILTAIDERGGRAEVGEVMEAIYRVMKDSFNQHDLEDTPNSRGEPRWSNNARFCRQVMINKGWLRRDSPRGVWEITDAGRNWLSKATWMSNP